MNKHQDNRSRMEEVEFGIYQKVLEIYGKMKYYQ
jgi:hypothetical protein